MEINQIRYFLEVAKTQHITKSAQKLHIAQPALSQAIHRLEKDLRVPLFVSKGRNIMLTEYGKYLQKKLEPIMENLDKIPQQLQIMAKLESDTIHLNVLAASALVTEAIIEYKKLHNEINFQFIQGKDNDLYDIGITTRLFYQLPEEKEDNTFVCTEKIFLAVPKNHRLASEKSVRLGEVSQEGFISLMGSRQLRIICDRYCRHAGFEPRIIFESDSPAAVQNMIAANMGIGFWPEFTWGKVNSDSVTLLEIQEPICQRDILIDFKKNKIDSSAVEEFFVFLKDYCTKAKQSAIDEDYKNKATKKDPEGSF
ncbi:MAG: LysR family transcriptional regulator [Acutalibacteraceae bacterium]